MFVDVVSLGFHTLYYKVQTEWFTLVGGSLPQDITHYGLWQSSVVNYMSQMMANPPHRAQNKVHRPRTLY